MVTIHTPSNTKYYAVWDNSGTWTQCDSIHTAEALAVLDEIPTMRKNK